MSETFRAGVVAKTRDELHQEADAVVMEYGMNPDECEISLDVAEIRTLGGLISYEADVMARLI